MIPNKVLKFRNSNFKNIPKYTVYFRWAGGLDLIFRCTSTLARRVAKSSGPEPQLRERESGLSLVRFRLLLVLPRAAMRAKEAGWRGHGRFKLPQLGGAFVSWQGAFSGKLPT